MTQGGSSQFELDVFPTCDALIICMDHEYMLARTQHVLVPAAAAAAFTTMMCTGTAMRYGRLGVLVGL
eukprot:21477-Heterococcus_DN1.PRE.7